MKHPNTKHGMYGTPTYNSWAAMKQRCYYEKHVEYPRYGARGITVCEAWQTFDGFFKDMGVRPDGMTIDRRDSSGNYEPGNCCWASVSAQANNKRNNHVIEWQGKSQSLSQWAVELGFKNSGILSKRLNRGWTIEQAMTFPERVNVNVPGGVKTRFQPKMLTHNGKTMSIKEWAAELGFANGSALGKRLQSGLPLSAALTPPKHRRKTG